MYLSIRTLVTGFVLTLSSMNLSATELLIELSEMANGGTLFTIQGSGEDHNGMPNGGGDNVAWFNLIGGDPFDVVLNSADFTLASPIDSDTTLTVTGMQLDYDPGDAQDDFRLDFSAIFDIDDPFTISGSSEVPGLDFALLTPGEYVRENDFANLTLRITALTPNTGPRQQLCVETEWGGVYRLLLHKNILAVHGELLAYPTDVLVNGSIKLLGNSLATIGLSETYPMNSGIYTSPEIATVLNVNLNNGTGTYDTTNIFTQEVFLGTLTGVDCSLLQNGPLKPISQQWMPANKR